MKNHLQNRAARLFPSAAKIRAVAATLMLLVLASCASQASREAEIAGVEAERVAIEQEGGATRRGSSACPCCRASAAAR